MGTLDPNPRNQPPPPPWQDNDVDDGSARDHDDADQLASDTFTVTDRWHNEHIASVRVYDDEYPGVCVCVKSCIALVGVLLTHIWVVSV